MSDRYLMVALEDGLHHSRVAGIFANIKSLPGIEYVVDLSVVSQQTLDQLLLPLEHTIPVKAKHR